jgi:hypothetical protein
MYSFLYFPSKNKKFSNYICTVLCHRSHPKELAQRGIDSAIAYVACMASRYDNPIPTWFLAPIDCSKIPEHFADFSVNVYCKYLI